MEIFFQKVKIFPTKVKNTFLAKRKYFSRHWRVDLHLTLVATLGEKAIFIEFRSLFLDYKGKYSSRKWKYSSHTAEIFFQNHEVQVQSRPDKSVSSYKSSKSRLTPKGNIRPQRKWWYHSTLRPIFPGRLLKDDKVEQLRDGGSREIHLNQNKNSKVKGKLSL